MHIIQKYCRYGAWTNKPHILCYYNVIISLSLSLSADGKQHNRQYTDTGPRRPRCHHNGFGLHICVFGIPHHFKHLLHRLHRPLPLVADRRKFHTGESCSSRPGNRGVWTAYAVCDLLSSICKETHYLFEEPNGVFGYFFQVCPLSASQMSLLLASAERYLAIQNPFRHEAIFTKRMVAGLCVGMWLYSIIYHSLPLLGWNQWDKYNPCSLLHFPLVYIFITHLHYCLFLLSIIGLYSKMLLIAHQQTQKIAVGPIGTDTTSGQRRFGFRAIKAARTIIIVVGCFICLTIPYVVMAVIMTLYWHNDKVPSDLLNILSGTSTYLLCVNSAINPIIYGVTMRPLRQAMKRMLCSCNSSGRTQIVSTINSTRRE